MQFIPIKTRAMRPPKDDIYKLLDEALPSLQEGDLLFITSKILAIHQGRCVPIGKGISKDELIKKEAEAYLPRDMVPGQRAVLTIKDHVLLPSAGIDSSNGRGHYILWPEHVSKACQDMAGYLRRKHKINHLAVIIIDSHSIPMRLGTVGISIGFFGLEPLKSYIGARGIFGGKLRMARVNIVDSLAATATLVMGEAAEQTPLVIARGADFIKFTDQETYQDLIVRPADDLYAPLLKIFKKDS